MTVRPLPAAALAPLLLLLPACHKHEGEHAGHPKATIVATTPKVKDVIITQQYVCQIRSQQRTAIKPLVTGRLEKIYIAEGQWVEEGQELFKILSVLYQAKLDTEKAEANLAEIELANTRRLFEQKVVSIQQVKIDEAKLERARAKVRQAEAEVSFTTVRAPFAGKIDGQYEQLGSTVKESDALTTLYDNTVMRVYFNVPEARYLGYKQEPGPTPGSRKDILGREVELVLANNTPFPHKGHIAAVLGKFNNETGNIQFRADFPNPEGLLVHGQTGTALIHRKLEKAVVIPQRATFEVLDKQYVYVVDDKDVVRQREIQVLHEQEDVYVVGPSLAPGERFVVEGVREVHDGQEGVKCEMRPIDQVLANQKYRAE